MTSALWTPSAPDIGRISTTLEKSAATRLVASASSCATARSTLSANAARGGSAAPTPKAVADLNTPRRETKGEGSSSEQAATSTTWSILRTEAQHRRVVPRTTNAIGTATIARADDRRRSRWRMRADRTVTVYFYNRQTRGATRLSSGTSVLRDTHVTRGNRVYRGAIQLTRVRARSRWPHWLPPSRADRLPTPPTNQPTKVPAVPISTPTTRWPRRGTNLYGTSFFTQDHTQARVGGANAGTHTRNTGPCRLPSSLTERGVTGGVFIPRRYLDVR